MQIPLWSQFIFPAFIFKANDFFSSSSAKSGLAPPEEATQDSDRQQKHKKNDLPRVFSSSSPPSVCLFAKLIKMAPI